MQQNYPTLSQAIFLLLRIVYVMAVIIIPYAAFRFLLHPAKYPSSFDSRYFCITIIAAQVLIFLYALKQIRKTDSFEWNKELNMRAKANWILILIGGLSVNFLIEPLAQVIPSMTLASAHLINLANDKIGGFLYLIFLAPILNELLFRGIILRGFLKNFHPAIAILASSLAYAVFHLSIIQAFASIFLCIFIGIVYWKTRSLALCISIHVLNNAIAYSLILSSNGIITIESQVRNTPIYLGIYLAAALFLSISLLQMHKMNEAND